jgi:hypothetical protein
LRAKERYFHLLNGLAMKTIIQIIGILSLALSLFTWCPGNVWAEQVTSPEASITVEARGPIHEAFAQPAEVNPQPGTIVPKQPPDPIPEEPPDQKPDGDNVQWIGGYWAWDTDRNDFIWVSGSWRVVPPDRQWVPGHWSQVAGGWQWVSGFWGSANQQEIQYLNPPPDSLENGPAVPAPDDNSIYVPGCWVFRQARYLWQPGFWMPGRPGWVWNNAYYSYTPSGSVYVNGYWDYPLENRGLLFAPVCFEQPLWRTPGWRYRPDFAVELGGLATSLFACPGYGHYYFGDYYDAKYRRLGFEPWFAYGSRHHDPLFNYYHWQHHGDASWERRLRDDYVARRDGHAPRPPHTFIEQNRVIQNNFSNRHVVNNIKMVTPLHDYHGDRFHVSPLTVSQREREKLSVQRFHDVRQQRVLAEKPAVVGDRRGATVVRNRLTLPPVHGNHVPSVASPNHRAVPAPSQVAHQPGPHIINRSAVPAQSPRHAVVSQSAPRIVSRPATAVHQPAPRALHQPAVAQQPAHHAVAQPAPRIVNHSVAAAPRPAPRAAHPAASPAHPGIAPQPAPRIANRTAAPAPHQPGPRIVHQPAASHAAVQSAPRIANRVAAPAPRPAPQVAHRATAPAPAHRAAPVARPSAPPKVVNRPTPSPRQMPHIVSRPAPQHSAPAPRPAAARQPSGSNHKK